MKPQELQSLFTRDDFLHELHHLLWMEPHINKGVQDDGWNCRDHATIVGGVAQMLGFTAAVILGKAAFIQGPKGNIAPMGRDVKTHSWVGVDRAGFYDLSVRLTGFTDFPEWDDWQTIGMVGEAFFPTGKVELRLTRSELEFENNLNAATNREGRNSAVYLGESFSDLNADDMSHALDRCNSPLTDKLRASFGQRQDFHAKAILHLVDLLQGKTAPILSMTQMEAWAHLVERSGNAIYRVCSRGKLK